MRRPTIQLFIVLVSIVALLAILTSAQLFATADGPLWIYLPSIFKQADGNASEPDEPGGGDAPGGEDDVYVFAPTGFEVEGNLALDGDPASNIDWETTSFPPAAHIEDPHSKRETDPTTFKPDGKFDQPESWSIQDGKVGPGQNELTNILAWLVAPNDLDDGRPSDPWLVMGMERTKKEGTFFLDFEYNQSVWNPAAGGLTRKPGDVVVGFELKGNPTDREKDLSVLIVQVFDDQPSLCEVTPGVGNMPAEVKVGTDPCPAYGDGGFYYRFLADGAILADSGLGEATMNAKPLPVPADWNSYDSQGRPRDVIPPFEFAEAAINLRELDIPIDCGAFSSMHAKDRSSLEPNADLKDLAGPIETPLNCRINGHKFLDLDGDGEWAGDPPEEGLEGWEIHIENLDTGWTDVTMTGEGGFYEFDALESGAHEVSEVCPANENWLQTKPGFTDFDNCGSETYTVDISLDNREVPGQDFGNIDPSFELMKQCPAEVFVGDEILYEFTVTNTGSPTLTNISVDDTLLGHVGDIATLEPDASETLMAAFVVETAGPITNTATASTDFASVTMSEDDTCVTDVVEPLVIKDAIGSFTLRYDWMIEKDVDEKNVIVLFPGQVVTPTYTLTVTAVPEMKDYQISGTITISNDTSMDAHFASVTDELSNGTPATVTCPGTAPYTVPANGSLTCTYLSDSFEELTNMDTNLATANRINNVGGTTEITGTAKIGPDHIEYSQSGPAENQKAVVEDDGEPAGNLPVTLDADETPWIFTYPREFGPLEICDQLVEVVNTATVTPIGDGLPDDDMASVTLRLFAFCTTFLGFEDQPVRRVDWDYNDFVIEVDFIPSYLESGNLNQFTFVMTQTAGLSGARHDFYIKPDFTATPTPAEFMGCNGEYTRAVNGTTDSERDGLEFTDGKTEIYVISDTLEKVPNTDIISVTIEFNATGDGCPLDIGEIDIGRNYHCDDCFFVPRLHATAAAGAPWITTTVEIKDPRMLSIPADWLWPPEKVAIWDAEPCVGSIILDDRELPEFQPFWWNENLCEPVVE